MTVAQQHPQRHCQRQPLPRLYHAWRVPVVLLVLTLASGQLAVVASIERRPLDGVGNNVANPTWGSKSTPYLRYRGVPNGSGGTRYNAYADGLASPARATQPNARNISNAVLATKSDVPALEASSPSPSQLTDLHAFFGQFITFDIARTNPNKSEPLPIPVPSDDMVFAAGTNLSFSRAQYNLDSNGARQQLNDRTAFIDGEGLYGGSADQSSSLRLGSGGKLKTSSWGGCPYNTAANNPSNFAMGNPHGLPRDQLLFGGDLRLNAMVPIIGIQTVFVREHNRLCDLLAAAFPSWNDETLFQTARKWVIAFLQQIVYNEYLPISGIPVPLYSGYKASVNPGIAVMFAACAFRFGHTQVASSFALSRSYGTSSGITLVRDQYFKPGRVAGPQSLQEVVLGMVSGISDNVDTTVVDDVRNFLFAKSGTTPSNDLAAINIQRGRDFGLLSYNDAREAYGLTRASAFSKVAASTEVAALLTQVYKSPDHADPWVAGIAEAHATGSLVGPFFNAVLADQFARLRDGDRFWFQNTDNPDPLTVEECEAIAGGESCNEPTQFVASTKLSAIIVRNTNATQTFPSFALPTAEPRAVGSFELEPNRVLRWSRVNDTALEFALSFPNAVGWTGIAFGGNAMEGADFNAVLVNALDERAVVVDAYAATGANVGSVYGLELYRPTPDAEQDVVLQSDTVEGGVRTVTWRRLFITPDTSGQDNPISATSAHTVSFAWNPTTAFALTGSAPYHGSNRIRNVQINFGTGVAAPQTSIKTMLAVVHGTMMMAIWLVNSSLAIFVARYRRHSRHWLSIHRTLQTISGIITWPNYILALAFSVNRSPFSSAHATLGTFVVFATTGQLYIGLMTRLVFRWSIERRTHSLEEMLAHTNSLKKRYLRLLEWCSQRKLHTKTGPLHRHFGKLLLVAALVQILLGILRFSADSSLSERSTSIMLVLFCVWVTAMVILFSFKEVLKHLKLLELPWYLSCKYCCQKRFRARFREQQRQLHEAQGDMHLHAYETAIMSAKRLSRKPTESRAAGQAADDGDAGNRGTVGNNGAGSRRKATKARAVPRATATVTADDMEAVVNPVSFAL